MMPKTPNQLEFKLQIPSNSSRKALIPKIVLEEKLYLLTGDTMNT